MIAHASTGLIETWFIPPLGTDALAGIAPVFPPVMLMTMISNGAMGGEIRPAVVINLALGAMFSAGSSQKRIGYPCAHPCQ